MNYYWIEVKKDHIWSSETNCDKCGESTQALMLGLDGKSFVSPHGSEWLFSAFEEPDARQKAQLLFNDVTVVAVSLIPVRFTGNGWELRDV